MLIGMADISTIRVPSGYEREFPGASRSAAEIAANLVRAATEFLTEIDRPTRKAVGLSARGFQTLAILDGAGGPLPGHSIAEHMLISSASMTSLLDTLQRRALIERHPHPTDRRKVLIHLTDDGQRIVDQQLPAIHAVITQALIAIPEEDREPFLATLTAVRIGLAALAEAPRPQYKARRRTRRADP
jgi:DNA-binding MarR family transcriptional regulator